MSSYLREPFVNYKLSGNIIIIIIIILYIIIYNILYFIYLYIICYKLYNIIIIILYIIYQILLLLSLKHGWLVPLFHAPAWGSVPDITTTFLTSWDSGELLKPSDPGITSNWNRRWGSLTQLHGPCRPQGTQGLQWQVRVHVHRSYISCIQNAHLHEHKPISTRRLVWSTCLMDA